MRKFMVLPMAGLLTLAVAAPAFAANASNSSGSAVIAQGSWYSQAGGVESNGTLVAWQESGASSAILQYFEQVGEYVDCTPTDETDEFFGFQGQYRFGHGEGRLVIGRGSADAQASGTLETVTMLVDDCTGHHTESAADSIAVSLDLVATGSKLMERGTGSFRIPSEFNSHSTYSTTSRIAAGTAKLGDEPEMAVDGGIGKVSWRDHSNS